MQTTALSPRGTMSRFGWPRPRLLLTWGVLAVAYAAAGKVGHLFATTQPNVTLVWAPAGIALAAVLLGGYRVWPGIALGALLVNATTRVPLGADLLIAAGNTLEPLAAARLLRRYAAFDDGLGRTRDVLAFAGLAAGCATAIGATVGVAALWLSSAVPPSDCPRLWLCWWSGDALGALLVAPVVLAWAAGPVPSWNAARFAEAAALVSALTLAGLIVFGCVARAHSQLAFVLFPFLIWSALRFGRRETASLTLLAAAIAVGGTAWGATERAGTFERRFAEVHAFLGVAAVSAMLLSASLAERTRAWHLLRAVADESSDALFVKDGEGRYLLFNEAAARFVGLPVEEVLGKDDAALFDPRSARLVMDRDREVMASGRPDTAEEELTAAGVARTFLATKAPYRDDRGRVIGVVGISRDITQRKRAERALRQSEGLFRSAFEDTNLAMVLTDPAHHFVRVNEAFARLFGYSQEEMLGLSMAEVTHPDDVAESLARRGPLEAGEGGYFQMEKRYLHKDGHVFWGLANVSLVRDPEGRPLLYVGQVQDVTERNRAEGANAKYIERLRILHQIDKALIAGEGPAEIAAAALVPLRELLGVPRAIVNLFDLEKGEVEWLAAAGRRRVRVGPGVRYSIRLMGDVGALGRGEIQSIDVHALPPGPEVDALLASGVHVYAVVPMIAGGRLIGALSFGGRELPSSAEQIGIAKEVATQFALALAHARLHEHVRRQTEELEVRVAESRRAEESLRVFRALIDRTNDSVEVIDPQTGRFLDVNQTACLAHGYTREEYLALCVADLDPSVASGTWREVAEGVRRAGSRIVEGSHRRKDGSSFPVEVNVNYIRLDRDYMLAVVRDVTERKRVEQALRQEREFIRLVLDTDPNLIFVKDRVGRFVLVNKALADLYATTPEGLVGRVTGEDVPAPVELPEYRRVEAEVLRTGTASVTEETNTRPDGRVYRFQTIKVPLMLPDGTTHVLGIAADITERRRTEEQLAQSQKMDVVGQLAGGVAHDFNNLLCVINGYGELLLTRLPKGDPARDMIQEMTKAGERAAGLTRQLLAFSRKAVLTPEIFDLNAVVVDIEKMLRRTIGEDVDLFVSLQTGLGRVKADPGQVEQVLMNLCVNARDAMPRGGKLTIETRDVELDTAYAGAHAEVRPGRHVLLAISDTGHGMTEEVKSRIFEPFFTTKEKGRGTGLGLAMVFGIVKQSGGSIEVYSEPGRGTSFKVYLPRVEKVVALRRSSPGLSPAPRGAETVLLVEDEESVRALTRVVLTGSGYSVLEAASGDEGLRVAAQHHGPIHLLISDVVMPELGGPEMAGRLVALRPEIKVLFLSGYTDDAIVRHGILQEKVNFLQKPFSTTALARKVRDVLDERS